MLRFLAHPVHCYTFPY